MMTGDSQVEVSRPTLIQAWGRKGHRHVYTDMQLFYILLFYCLMIEFLRVLMYMYMYVCHFTSHVVTAV